MVGTGSNSNEASTAVGEGHLHRVFTVGHQIGIIAQLAITVITPCVHCAIPAQSHGETITCYHADQIFEGPQLGRRGVLLVVGQLNRCSQHRLLTAGTQLTHDTGGNIVLIPECVVAPGPHSAVLLQSGGGVLTQHQLRVSNAIGNDDTGKGALTGDGVLGQDLGLALPEGGNNATHGVAAGGTVTMDSSKDFHSN